MRFDYLATSIVGADWYKKSVAEWQGGIGVAMMKAFLTGSWPKLGDLCKALNIHPDDGFVPYHRLKIAGAFNLNSGWRAYENPDLNGRPNSPDYHREWAYVAAVAGGLLEQEKTDRDRAKAKNAK